MKITITKMKCSHCGHISVIRKLDPKFRCRNSSKCGADLKNPEIWQETKKIKVEEGDYKVGVNK
jgi:hypothetical protein